jgi:hypothetical protein
VQFSVGVRSYKTPMDITVAVIAFKAVNIHSISRCAWYSKQKGYLSNEKIYDPAVAELCDESMSMVKRLVGLSWSNIVKCSRGEIFQVESIGCDRVCD